MKLLRIIHSSDPALGGPIEGILRITPHLHELGVSTTLISLDSPSSPWLKSLSIQNLALGPSLTGYGFVHKLPQQISSIARNYDVVIVHGLWQYHSLASWIALHPTDIPYYVYPHGMLDPWFKYTYPLKHLKKVIYWGLVENRILRDAAGVIFTTEVERTLASHTFRPYQVSPFVVGYGTSLPTISSDHQKSAFFHQYPYLHKFRILLFLGRIHPKKGIDLLIRAFSTIAASTPDLHLVIAGSDHVGYQKHLEKLSVSLGLRSRITWTGMLSGDLKWGALRASEVFCLPSYQENFGIAVSEALACGIPVIISESVNISQEVLAAHAGLVHPPTFLGVSQALATWFSFSISERHTFSTNAYHLFNLRFNLNIIARRLHALLLQSFSLSP